MITSTTHNRYVLAPLEQFRQHNTPPYTTTQPVALLEYVDKLGLRDLDPDLVALLQKEEVVKMAGMLAVLPERLLLSHFDAYQAAEAAAL